MARIAAGAMVGWARLAIVVAVYLGSTLIGATLATVAARPGASLPENLGGALLGGAVLPLALTAGFALWPIPEVLRGRHEPELVPARVDAVVLVGGTLAVALIGASLVPDATVGRLGVAAGFGAVALGSALVVVASGGRHVAVRWLGMWH
jgi:hypothetical protein